MTERLFDDVRKTNPNTTIMVVEQQEGGTEDDNYFGSIGDATAQHIQSLDSSGLQMWRELILMRSGEMYRMVPSWDENDRDPNNLRGRDLDQYVARFKGKVSESEMACIFEAVEQEKERRELEEQDNEESEDALDQECVSYDDWEKQPTKFEKEDIPSTPRDRAVYMGDTRQAFYDEFPVGHPDAHTIEQFLNMMNRPWEKGLDFGYAEWVEKELDATPMRPYVREYLKRLVYAIATDNDKANDWTTQKKERYFSEKKDDWTTRNVAVHHDGYVKKALLAIDRCWAVELKNEAAKKAMQNPMTRLILKKEKEWSGLHKEGFSIHGVIKQFGQLLFTDFRDKMNGYLWARYRRARDNYAPRVILKGVDINRCSIQTLGEVLRIGKEDARNVWFARPFSSLEHAYSTGYVKPLSFADDEKTDKVVLFVEKHAKIACENKDVRRINDVCKALITMQREKRGNLTSDQWSAIWRYYNILKAQVLEAVNGQGEKHVGS